MKRSHIEEEKQAFASVRLTSTQAAALLQVHESSIKRWCNQGVLAYSQTRGKHRRFEIDDILAFVKARQHPFPFASFEQEQDRLVRALVEYWQNAHLNNFLEIARTWFKGHQREWLSRLFVVLYEEYDVPLYKLFDELVCALMGAVGQAWQEGRLQVGEEHLISQTILDGMKSLRSSLQRKRTELPGEPQFQPPKVAISTGAEGSQHELGAYCIRLLLEEQGWQTLYTGPNLPAIELAMLQQDYEAELVCVSFVRPQRLSDVQRALQMLKQLYKPNLPYALVLGGSALEMLGTTNHSVEGMIAEGEPFHELSCFTRLEQFHRWLGDYTPPSTPQS